MSRNQLTHLPEDFGNLFQLTYLNLHENSIISLPISMAKLNNLQYLNLSKNPLTQELYNIAGNCFNAAECKKCALNILVYLNEKENSLKKENTG